MPNLKRNFLIFVVLTIFICVSYFLLTKNNPPSNSSVDSLTFKSQIRNDAKIKIADNEVTVQIAKLPEEKSRGLSGKTKLKEYEGMIFVFPTKTYPSFWMKDMNFPIDIIWISDDVIVHIDQNVPNPTPKQSDASLPLYKPPKPIDYVLEVNAGFTQKYGVKIGDIVEINF